MKIKKNHSNILFFVLLSILSSCAMMAQEVWSIDRCMAYAVENNKQVEQYKINVANAQMDKLEAVGNFLPSIGVNTTFGLGFGRSVDPETNTYNNIANLNNGYAVSASLPIFKGGSLIIEAQRSNAAVLMNKAALEQMRDEVAMKTFDAYIIALYSYGTLKLAQSKLAESDTALLLCRRENELGLKSHADLVQAEAEYAADRYNLTKQKNALADAMLTLKQSMNYPLNEDINLDTAMLESPTLHLTLSEAEISNEELYTSALEKCPEMQTAALNFKMAQMERRSYWSLLMPSIGIYGGVSTTYFTNLTSSNHAPFFPMLKDNLGTSAGISFSLPAFIGFNGFRNINALRRAKNNLRKAELQYEITQEEMRKKVQQALQDRSASLAEMEQMELMVKSDRIAYATVKAEYNEGLKTSLDLRESASKLMQSETSLIQCRLSFILKCRLVDYYMGKELIRENEL